MSQQRTTVVNIRNAPEGSYVYVGRAVRRSRLSCARSGSIWGNPFQGEDWRERYLEHVLCQIHRHRRSIHVGLLLVVWCDPQLTVMMPRRNREESIPSLHLTAADRIVAAAGERYR